MQRLYSMFPGNAPGVGLLVLRCGLAAHLLCAAPWAGHSAALLLVIATAAGLCLGALHRAVCTLAFAIEATLIGTCHVGGLLLDVIHLGSLLAAALLGPGAYSIDGKRFGRRRIVPPPG